MRYRLRYGLARRAPGFVGAALVLVALLMAPALAMADAVVLMYHRVGEGRFPSTNIRIDQFEAHLEYLAAHDFHVMALPEIMRRLEAGEALPEKAVAITFDDAYRSVREHAHPRLRERGWPYTLFVATDAVDQGGDHYLSWQAMRAMRGAGVVFANHSASHAHLVRRYSNESEAQWRSRIAGDVETGLRRLIAELGRDAVALEPKLFAYPYGEYDQGVAAILAQRDYIAFGQHSGVVAATDDRLALPRFTFDERYAEMPGFRSKVNGHALPVSEVLPWSPVVADGKAPRMVLKLADFPDDPGQLRCFFGGETIAVERLGSNSVAVQADGGLPPGRSRYNCTSPAPDGGFYWYGRLWLNDSEPAWD